MKGARKALLGILLGAAFLLSSCAGYSPPVAVIDASPTSGDAPLTVTFDISGSYDRDGTVVGYELDFGDGTAPATGTDITQPIAHTYGDDGIYTATLTVTDNHGLTGQDSVEITVTNPAPTASFTFSPESPKVGETVTFDASGSVDPAGLGVKAQKIVSYEWDFGDGATGSGMVTTHVYNDSGDYEVTLTVTDDDGATGTDAVVITVTAEFSPIKALIDSYHRTDLVGTGAWYEDNYPGGFTSSYLTSPITYDDLKNYDLFIVQASYKPKLGPKPTASEAEAVRRYVEEGGAVIIWGEDDYWGLWTSDYVNVLASQFDVFFNTDQLLDPTDYDTTVVRVEDDPERHIVFHNVTSHPTTKGVNSVWVHGACSLINNNPNAVTVIAGDDDTYSDRYPGYPKGSYPPVAIVLQYGAGRIVFMGDSDWFRYDVYDNKKFIMNLLQWLVSP